MKVLFIEDELYLARPVVEILKKENYMVELVTDGEEGLSFGLTGLYDLILLDIMLPSMDGLEVLRRLRSEKIKTPILMLTARDQIEDQVKGLDMGADDYLPKPYEYPVLLARLRALARRNDSFHEDNLLKFGNVEFNPYSLVLKSEFGTQKLTLKEGQLLEMLIQRGTVPTSKEIIIEKLWEFESDAHGKNVEYHISVLRRKMKKVNSQASIKAIWGAGYRLIT